jgi:hypothetical protein
MDTSISKFIKLIGVTFLVGCLLNGFFCSQAAEWGYVIGAGIIGAISAGVFTTIWAVAAYSMMEALNGKQRSEITEKSIIGAAVALPAVIACISFVGGAVAASYHQEFAYANWLFLIGDVLCGALTIIWSVAEISFVAKIMSINSKK